ncbi:50S ribosomal protein L25 [Candidatus Saccharibacteria bacterium]|nr:50S ribosomal protein L25 [Candidatus Saccharibacteria bacterium]
MSETSLKLQKREAKGKKVKVLRKQGIVPGVLYGAGSDPILVQSDYNPIEKVIKIAGKHTPVELDIDGKKQLAMVKNIDIDPVKRRLINIEFLAIKASEAIETSAPIRLVGMGESEAEKAGLGIAQVLDGVEIKAKPADLPEAIEVDVVGLTTLEDKITLSDLKLPAGVEFANPDIDLSATIVNVYDPAEQAAKAEAQEAAEKEAEAEATAEAAPTETTADKPAETESEEKPDEEPKE